MANMLSPDVGSSFVLADKTLVCSCLSEHWLGDDHNTDYIVLLLLLFLFCPSSSRRCPGTEVNWHVKFTGAIQDIPRNVVGGLTYFLLWRQMGCSQQKKGKKKKRKQQQIVDRQFCLQRLKIPVFKKRVNEIKLLYSAIPLSRINEEYDQCISWRVLMPCHLDKDSDCCNAVHFLIAKENREITYLTQYGPVLTPRACLYSSIRVL